MIDVSNLRRKGTELRGFEWDMIKAYLTDNADRYDEIKFSVRVGKGAEPPPDIGKSYADMVRNNTQLKIDCVARRNDGYYELIEAKERALPGVYGQLAVYMDYFMKEVGAVSHMTVLCETVHTDVLEFLQKQGIEVHIFGGDFD